MKKKSREELSQSAQALKINKEADKYRLIAERSNWDLRNCIIIFCHSLMQFSTKTRNFRGMNEHIFHSLTKVWRCITSSELETDCNFKNYIRSLQEWFSIELKIESINVYLWINVHIVLHFALRIVFL